MPKVRQDILKGLSDWGYALLAVETLDGGRQTAIRQPTVVLTRAMAARKNEQSAERREAYFRGHVQGVGFRYTVRQLASAFLVFGSVRNLADGRVHVVAEGSPQALDQFFAAIAQRMSGHIRETTIDTRPAIGEFDDFEIRH
jgi:acylphosphatase